MGINIFLVSENIDGLFTWTHTLLAGSLALITKGTCNFISGADKCKRLMWSNSSYNGGWHPKSSEVLCPWKEKICVSPTTFFFFNFYFIKSKRLVNFKLIFLTLTFFDSNLDVQLNKITPQLPWTTQPYLTFHISHNTYLHKILS